MRRPVKVMCEEDAKVVETGCGLNYDVSIIGCEGDRCGNGTMET